MTSDHRRYRVEVGTACATDDGPRWLWRVVAVCGRREAWLRAMRLRLDGVRARWAEEAA